MKKESPGSNLDAKLEMLSHIYSFKPYVCQDPRIARAHTAQIKKYSALLACLAQRLSAFTLRCGTDTSGRGTLEPPLEDGARTKLFDREFQFRESHTEAEICSFCSLSNLASHSLQLLALSRVLVVQALQTSSKTTAIWLVPCIRGRAKNLGLLGQSLLTKLAIITRSQFGWSFASCTLSSAFFYLFVKGVRLILLPHEVASSPSLPTVGNLSQMS